MACRRASRCREADIQPWLDKRRPGPVALHDAAPGAATRSRSSPACSRARPPARRSACMIDNDDQRSKDYRNIADQLPAGPCRLHLLEEIRHPRLSRRRPRLGARDGVARRRRRGRAQGARRPDVAIRGALVQIGPHAIDRADGTGRRSTTIRSGAPTRRWRRSWAEYLDGVRKAGSSAGAVIEVVASGVPAGLGEPIYGKLDGDLARAMMRSTR